MSGIFYRLSVCILGLCSFYFFFQFGIVCEEENGMVYSCAIVCLFVLFLIQMIGFGYEEKLRGFFKISIFDICNNSSLFILCLTAHLKRKKSTVLSWSVCHLQIAADFSMRDTWIFPYIKTLAVSEINSSSPFFVVWFTDFCYIFPSIISKFLQLFLFPIEPVLLESLVVHDFKTKVNFRVGIIVG